MQSRITDVIYKTYVNKYKMCEATANITQYRVFFVSRNTEYKLYCGIVNT